MDTSYFTRRPSWLSAVQGVLVILSVCGIAFAPDQATKMVAGGSALIGLGCTVFIGAFLPDKKKEV